MTARSGMANLIVRLRGMTQAGTADYTVAGTAWWNDDQLQTVFDDNSLHLNRVQLAPDPEYLGGTAFYHDYWSPHGELEEASSGTIFFSVEDADGDEAGTANYSVEYGVGKVRFTADQGGTAYFLRARSYNLNATAAQVWREMAGWRAQYVTFKADDQSMNQSEWFDHCMTMADYYDRAGGGKMVQLRRSDMT